MTKRALPDPGESRPCAWVIGDVLIDVNRYVSYSRPSPENSSCPVGVDERSEVLLGGAGNVARWLAMMPESCFPRVTLTGLWGRGENDYHLLVQGANEAKVTLSWCLERRRAAISTKERVYLWELSGGYRQVVRIDADSDARIDETESAQLVAGLDSALAYSVTPPILVIADYGKGVFSGGAGAALRTHLGRFVEEKGLLTVVNSKFPELWRQFPADVFVCNRHEYEALWPSDSDPIKIEAKHLIVTWGEHGVHGYRPTGTGCGGMKVMVRCLRAPSLAAKVVDVTGAGDAFLAGIATWLSLNGHTHGATLADDQLRDAVDLGQAMAARCCSQLGCGTPNLLEEPEVDE